MSEATRRLSVGMSAERQGGEAAAAALISYETVGRSPRPVYPLDFVSLSLYNIFVQHEEHMSKQVSYSYARQNFAEILTEAADTQEPVIVSRRGHEDVAILPASELRSLEETAHLMRSPANARRLLTALHRALSNEGRPESTAELRSELELE